MGLRVPLEELRRFWEHLISVKHPWACTHPGAHSHIPISLYGDDCRIGEATDKVTAFFMSLTLFKPKSVRHSQFLLACVRNELIIEENLCTISPILRHIVWSCNIAFHGMWPHRGPYGETLPASKQRLSGQQLCEGNAYTVAEVKGDWAWHCKVLRLVNTWKSLQVCFLCRARADERGGTPYTEFGENAAWAATQVDTLNFINEMIHTTPGQPSSPSKERAPCASSFCVLPGHLNSARHPRSAHWPLRLQCALREILQHARLQPGVVVHLQRRVIAS